MKGRVYIERVGNRIHARIPYADGDGPRYAKKVPGARWSASTKTWTFALEWAICVALRRAFGDALEIGPELTAWARAARVSAEATIALSSANSAALSGNVKRVAPRLAAAIATRPYQEVGAAFVATGRQTLIADEMRLGKTLQSLAGIIEAYPDGGNFLIFAPKTAVLATWVPAINRWFGESATVTALSGTRAQREERLQSTEYMIDKPKTGFHFVISNIEMARVKGITDNLQKSGGVAEYPGLFEIVWDGFIVDESHKALVHKTGVPTQTRVGMRRLSETNPTALRIALSGTPFRGKRHQIWGTLNWLKPELYTSYWRWVEMYFDVSHDGYGKVIGDLRGEMESEFYRELSSIMLRRTKGEVRSELPPRMYAGDPIDGEAGGPVGIWLDMEPAQAKQYRMLQKEATVFASGGDIIADGILAEMTRAKQLSGSCLDVAPNGAVVPVLPSNKWDWIMAFLEDLGIAGEPSGTEKVVIASQFTKLVNLLATELASAGIAVHRITGEISATERARVQADFQTSDRVRVMLLNTTAGGVSLDLDAASTVILLDETWNADDQEQVEARIEPTTDERAKTSFPTVYYLRSRGTIEEGIARTNLDNDSLVKAVMDGRRGVETLKRLLSGEGVA